MLLLPAFFPGESPQCLKQPAQPLLPLVSGIFQILLRLVSFDSRFPSWSLQKAFDSYQVGSAASELQTHPAQLTSA